MVWYETVGNLANYRTVSFTQGLVLMQNDTLSVRSSMFSPLSMAKKPGDVIVRAYDPWADHYTETGKWLYVNRDRHLAHRRYT